MGFAFIYMNDERDAGNAIQALDRTEFGGQGRWLHVEWTKAHNSLVDRVFSVEYALHDDDDRRYGYSPERRRGYRSLARRDRDSAKHGSSPYNKPEHRGIPNYERAETLAHESYVLHQGRKENEIILHSVICAIADRVAQVLPFVVCTAIGFRASMNANKYGLTQKSDFKNTVTAVVNYSASCGYVLHEVLKVVDAVTCLFSSNLSKALEILRYSPKIICMHVGTSLSGLAAQDRACPLPAFDIIFLIKKRTKSDVKCVIIDIESIQQEAFAVILLHNSTKFCRGRHHFGDVIALAAATCSQSNSGRHCWSWSDLCCTKPPPKWRHTDGLQGGPQEDEKKTSKWSARGYRRSIRGVN
ncbi:hypothetical protein MUK42_37303 [Musa troglodytarum]|uniref:RRM domain-containing protein n=1 Tax=Musa troglodytarum TaxID=320322 RepID=A0A9E7E897_9LILI|nr:hypothetical protein MUK42_37303 [Musa troglodytarum]